MILTVFSLGLYLSLDRRQYYSLFLNKHWCLPCIVENIEAQKQWQLSHKALIIYFPPTRSLSWFGCLTHWTQASYFHCISHLEPDKSWVPYPLNTGQLLCTLLLPPGALQELGALPTEHWPVPTYTAPPTWSLTRVGCLAHWTLVSSYSHCSSYLEPDPSFSQICVFLKSTTMFKNSLLAPFYVMFWHIQLGVLDLLAGSLSHLDLLAGSLSHSSNCNKFSNNAE